MRPADRKFDRVAERAFPGRRGKGLKRVESHGAVPARALDRVIESVASLHRDERKFESPEALKTQILKDVHVARSYFRRVKAWLRPLAPA